MAEDHQVVRQAMKLLLERQTGYTVVAEASDGMQAVELCEKHRPTVLVTDLTIPKLHGLDVIRQVRSRCRDTKIIILSMRAEEPTIAEAMRNGAMAYVLKDAPASELLTAITEVLNGLRYLSPAIREKVSLVGEETDVQTDVYDSLTARERLVLELAAEGTSSADIAKKLFISPRTAETHRANLMRKLRLNSQTDLVRFAIRKGIIPP